MYFIRFSKQKSLSFFKTKGLNNFKTAFDLVSYVVSIGCLPARKRNFCRTIIQRRRCQLLLFTFLKFLSNFFDILKDPMRNVIASACIACRLFVQETMEHNYRNAGNSFERIYLTVDKLEFFAPKTIRITVSLIMRFK